MQIHTAFAITASTIHNLFVIVFILLLLGAKIQILLDIKVKFNGKITLFCFDCIRLALSLHQLFDSYVSSFLIMIFGFWLVMEKGSQ